MKLYRYYIDWNNEIKMTELEVEEKPKTYSVIGGSFYPSRVSKGDIDKLIEYGRLFYTFNNDEDAFKCAVIEKSKNDLEKENRRHEKTTKDITDRLMAMEERKYIV